MSNTPAQPTPTPPPARLASARQALAHLHTWAGLLLGSLLFTIFWMGTLTVFDREFDRWMQPGTRVTAPVQGVSLDQRVLPAAQALVAGSTQWGVTLPSERVAHVRLFYRGADKTLVTRAIDPNTGELIADSGSLGGTRFFFPFHYKLHLAWKDLGYWLVGLASMAMLVLLVSGVVIHRKLVAEFFLLRPRKKLQRASLDLHNLTGVLALPFHFVIALSGLVIFIGVYFPQSHTQAYGQGQEAKSSYLAEAYGRYSRPRLQQPAKQRASLDQMLEQAEARWAGGRAYFVRVWHEGDAASYVELRRSFADDITMNLDQIYFDAQTGAMLHRFEAAPVMRVQRFVSGLHFIQFDHWGIRWLYFFGGLAGCVMIATGFVFWLEARRARHARQGLAGVRWVEALTVASVMGPMVATGAYLVANRLLPPDAQAAGWARPELEVWAFVVAWLLSAGHAAWRTPGPAAEVASRAWREQCVAVAALAALAVVLNAVTTGDHPGRTLARGDVQVLGVDLMLLAVAAFSAWVARRLAREQGQAGVPQTTRTARGLGAPLHEEAPRG
jgi:uncharacterized iron-regulated membrane protein